MLSYCFPLLIKLKAEKNLRNSLLTNFTKIRAAVIHSFHDSTDTQTVTDQDICTVH